MGSIICIMYSDQLLPRNFVLSRGASSVESVLLREGLPYLTEYVCVRVVRQDRKRKLAWGIVGTKVPVYLGPHHSPRPPKVTNVLEPDTDQQLKIRRTGCRSVQGVEHTFPLIFEAWTFLHLLRY